MLFGSRDDRLQQSRLGLRAIDLAGRVNDRGGGWQGGHREANAWDGTGSIRACPAVSRGCLPRRLCCAAQRGAVDPPRISEEIPAWHQDAGARS